MKRTNESKWTAPSPDHREGYGKGYKRGYQDAMKDCTAAYMKGGAEALILWVQENNVEVKS